MLTNIQTVLSSKSIRLLLILSASTRAIFLFLVLPNYPSNFGPDEGTYAALAKFVSKGLPTQDFPAFGPELYNSCKSFILPAAILIKLGIGELNSVRLVSSIYGFASTLMFAMSYVAIKEFNCKHPNRLSNPFSSRSVLLIAIFTFFPSNFLWSIIGLRESSSQFWLISTLYFSVKIFSSPKRKQYLYVILSIASLALSFGARPKTALIFALVSLFLSILLFLKRPRYALFVLVVVLGTFLGQKVSSSPEVIYNKPFTAFPITKYEKDQESHPGKLQYDEYSPNIVISSRCTMKDQIIVIENSRFYCKAARNIEGADKNNTNSLLQVISIVKTLESKRNQNALNAESALSPINCQNSSTKFSVIIKCNIKELPKRLFAFLFRPLLFYDRGASELSIAALENVFWALILLLGLIFTFKGGPSNVNFLIRVSLFTYVLAFSSAAALYEGNLGTAFRHKSAILWPLLIILILRNDSMLAKKR